MMWLATSSRGRDVTVTVGVILEVVARTSIDPDVVVGELAHLCVVNTKDFRLLRTAHAHAWNVVHDPKNDSLHIRRWKIVSETI